MPAIVRSHPRHVLNVPTGGCMIDALRAAMREADEVAIAVSFVRASGLQLLLPALSGLRERKAKVRLLTSTYLDVT
jgi:HKD family nuclease